MLFQITYLNVIVLMLIGMLVHYLVAVLRILVCVGSKLHLSTVLQFFQPQLLF